MPATDSSAHARRAVATLAVALLIAASCRSAGDTSIPDEFAATYASLDQALTAWDKAIPTVATRTPVFGGHNLVANANRGTDLLAPDTLAGVDLELDAFKRMGLGGVSITISFPLFDPDQPRSADYISFYETVAKHVRDRGLVLSVEEHVAFVGTSFSSVGYDFRSTSFDQFVALDREMTRVILTRIRPDYLTLLSEPDTFAKITGYREASTPDGAAAMIGRIVNGLDRGGTKVGAGAGSWLANAPDYDTAFVRAGVDYVDLHIYPITAATITTTRSVLETAHTLGRPVVLDEAWLYKIGPGESVAPSLEQQTEYFRRDAFTFWSPLDARFLALVARLARTSDVVYVAPFWTTYFFGGVDYGGSTKGLAYAELAHQANQAATKGMRSGSLTPTGAAYAKAARVS